MGCEVFSSSNLFLMASFMNSALLLYPLMPRLMIWSISSMISFGSLTVVYSSEVELDSSEDIDIHDSIVSHVDLNLTVYKN